MDGNIYLPFKTRKKRNNKIKDKKVGDGRRFEEGGKNSTKRVEEVEGELLFLKEL